MFDTPTPSVDRSDLIRIIRQVRGRWRLRLALRGAAGVVAAGVLGLALSALALEFWRFSPAAVIAFRVTTSLLFAALITWLLVLPLRRRVSDGQVALYLEEHEPSLEAAMVSAVDASGTPDATRQTTAGDLQASPALVRRLIETAIERCETTGAGRRVEETHLHRSWTALAVTVLTAVAVFLFGPAYLRQGASALLLISRSVEAASPYRIAVQPGNATVPRGSDQTIGARLIGFESEQTELLVRRTPNAPFERMPMVATSDAGAYEGMLFDLAGPVDYFVQAAGVRSPRYTLQVADIPYVKQLQLEYHFPAYTGLPPRKIENGGDIAVLQGTEIYVSVIPTMPTPRGRVLLYGTDSIALTPGGATLAGRFTVDRSGFYGIELENPQSTLVAASPQYTIDALRDQAPSVSIAKPGRDTTATPLEELFVEARADDDFGVRELQLVYSVNGGAEQTRTLFSTQDRVRPEVSAGHTFYLEELGVAPGDSLSYYARATDNDQVDGPNTVMSDLYFLQIRPFDKEFRAAVSMGGSGAAGGGAAGGAGSQVDALSQQQKQIIAATFNMVRDRKTFTADKLRENLTVVTLAQARLREQVEGLVGRMTSNLVEPNPAFEKIAGTLPKAAAEMRAGETKLQAQSPDAALPPENRALRYLQQAEDEYQLQVSVGPNAGGAGGAGSISEDLAGLFKQELDKLANQYETTQQAEQQGRDQQIDELMERLKELARRQEQEAERQRQRAAAGQVGQGGGADQRALAEQAEEAARRLERLSREQNRTDMMDAARRLQEAADAMRRAAASGDANSAAQAGTALERLREAQRRLEREQGARGQRDIQDAMRKADEIAAEQSQMARDVAALGQAGAGRPERVQRLTDRKDALESRVADLERQLDTTAGDLRGEERDASRKLQEAAASIRDDKIKEKIHYSRTIIQRGSPETARALEQEIGSNLEALRKKVGEAAAAQAGSTEEKMAQALEKARDLARGLESLDQRMRERGSQAQNGPQQQSQTPQQGQAGQQGQGGQQGQAGQHGQGGQQGQAGQNANARGTPGYTPGPWGPDNGLGWGGPWGYSPEDIRQYRGEIRQWTSETQELRNRLREQNVDVADLDPILRALRELDADRVYKDAKELERLQTFVTEGVKRFEYGLRRKAEGSQEQLTLSGSDEVPRGFRELVEEYYRALSRRSR